MKDTVFSTTYNGILVQANSKKGLYGAVELEMLRDPETKFLHKESAEKYLGYLIEKYGTESERVKLLKQRIKESFEEV